MIKIIILFSLIPLSTLAAEDNSDFLIDKTAMLQNVNKEIVSLGALKKCTKGQQKQAIVDECLRQYIIRTKKSPKNLIIKKVGK